MILVPEKEAAWLTTEPKDGLAAGITATALAGIDGDVPRFAKVNWGGIIRPEFDSRSARIRGP